MNRRTYADVVSKTNAVCENRVKKVTLDLSDFQVIRVPGDGSCLYTSISYGLFGSGNGSRAVRTCIARHVWKKWSKFRAFVPNASKFDYFCRHARGNEFGGHVQVQAAADFFNLNIHVITENAAYSCYASNPTGAPPSVYLQFSGPPDHGHYDFLAPRGWQAPTWNWQFCQATRQPRVPAGAARRADPRGAATQAAASEPGWTQVAPRRGQRRGDIRSPISPYSPLFQPEAVHVQTSERGNDADSACFTDILEPPPPRKFEILKITGHYENLFKILIRVDGLLLTAAIDTGATRTIIHSRFVTNKAALRRCDIKLQVANQTPMEVDGVYDAELTFGDSLTCTHGLIVASTIDVDILIGNDIMTKYNLGAIINFRNDTASFRSGEAEAVLPRVDVPLPPRDANRTDSRSSTQSGCSYGIYSIKPIWVPAGAVTAVRGSCRNNYILPAVFESRKLLVSEGLESLECFLTDSLEVPVLNSTPNELYIPRNTLLGRVKTDYSTIPTDRIMKIGFGEALDRVEKGMLVLDDLEFQQQSQTAGRIAARPAGPPCGHCRPPSRPSPSPASRGAATGPVPVAPLPFPSPGVALLPPPAPSPVLPPPAPSLVLPPPRVGPPSPLCPLSCPVARRRGRPISCSYQVLWCQI